MQTDDAPVLIAYDGSALADSAIAEAGRQLGAGRTALVTCVWHPVDVGFNPVNNRAFDADSAPAVRQAAQTTAAHGASLAGAAGFRAIPLTVEAVPTWRGIIEAANEQRATLIVIGTHRRSGVIGHLGGSVAAAVISHASCAILLVHDQRH